MVKKYGGVSLGEIQEAVVVSKAIARSNPLQMKNTSKNQRSNPISNFISALLVFSIIFGPLVTTALISAGFPEFYEQHTALSLMIALSPILAGILWFRFIARH